MPRKKKEPKEAKEFDPSQPSDFSKVNKNLRKLPSKKQSMADKKELMNYFHKSYGVTYFNKTFLLKLDHINDGNLTGLVEPVSYRTLQDLFQRYRNYLYKLEAASEAAGKHLDKGMRLNYDLAIVLSKYPDYLEGLRQEAVSKTQALEYLEQHSDKQNNTANIAAEFSTQTQVREQENKGETLDIAALIAERWQIGEESTN